MAFLVSDPPPGVRSSDYFFELIDEGKGVAFLFSDSPSGVRSRSASITAGTSLLLGGVLFTRSTIDVIERCCEGIGDFGLRHHCSLCGLFFEGANTRTSRSDSGGASSAVATKRFAVDGSGHVVLVEVGWVAHCWVGY